MIDPATIPDGLLSYLQSEEMRSLDASLNEDRKIALDFYHGRPFGDEMDGRSQLVTRDVAEVVDAMTVAIMRTVVSDKVVEFEARESEDPERPQLQEGQDPAQAEQMYRQMVQQAGREAQDRAQDATALVAWQFMRAQSGYRIAHDCLKAGLLEKTGVFKTWAEPTYEMVEGEALGSEIDADETIVAAEPIPDAYSLREDGTLDQAYTVRRRVQGKTKYRDEAVPNEEFRFSPEARELDDAAYIQHRTRCTLSALMKDHGLTEAEAEVLFDDSNDTQSLSDARDEGRERKDSETSYGKGINRQVWRKEEYTRWDMGDGTDTLICVHRVGNTVLSIQEVEEQPFVIWCPFPMHHRIVGQSLADKTMDIQRVRSVLLRQAMDALYFANAPRPYIDMSQCDENTIDDVLSIVPGSPIRGRGPNSVQFMTQPFAAPHAFTALEFMSGERESRTGVTRHNQGLSADTLNNMLCVETPVPLIDGTYKLLGDVVAGDMLVGRDGRATKVLVAHEAHNPERAYKITFASGESILSGGEHLWTIQTGNDKKHKREQTVDTDTLAKVIETSGTTYIPRTIRPLTGMKSILPLDPYMLGLWLGDGSRHAPRITTMDPEIIDYLEKWAEGRGKLVRDKHQNSGEASSYYVGGLYQILRSMKLLLRGDAAKDVDIIGKHIPEAYFTASYEQRLELLQGLMDTDGCHHSNALSIFCQQGGQILDDTVRLIESLGGWPVVRRIKAMSGPAMGPHGKMITRHGDHYQVTFSLADCPYKLTRKAEKWVASKRNLTTQPIRSIEPAPIRLMRCLTVEAEDGLFCVGKRFTVTHNTATGYKIQVEQGAQWEEYVARNYAEALAELFEKKLRLMKRYGAVEPVRTGGEFKRIDASSFEDEMDMTIRVGLGTGRKDARLQARMFVLEQQKEALAVGSALVDEDKIYNSMAGIISDSALGDPNMYVNDPAQSAAPDEGEKKDPATIEAEGKVAIEQQRQQFEQQKAQAQMQLEADKSAAMVEAQREKSGLEAELARNKAEFEADLAERKFQFEMQMAERKMLADIAMRQATQDATVPQNREGGRLDA